MARGSNQCAIAHKVYEGCRTLYSEEVREKLHGELVAVGVIAQLYYNGEETAAADFRKGLIGHGLPFDLPTLGAHQCHGGNGGCRKRAVACGACPHRLKNEKSRKNGQIDGNCHNML